MTDIILKMFPSQTSLVPVTVALVKFFESRRVPAFSQNYPYWYLGSTPFKYLIGPIVPVVTWFLHSLAPNVSLFTIITVLVLVLAILSSFGWALLATKIAGESFTNRKKLYLLVLTAGILTPWKYLSALAVYEASDSIAKSLIPFVLVTVWLFLIKKDKKSLAIASLFVAIVLLINSNILLSVICGVGVLCLTVSFKNGKFKFLDRKLKRGLMPLLAGFLLASLWYGPGFWWVQLVNPGIGGSAGAQVIVRIIDFTRNIVPLLAVLVVIYVSAKIKDRITVFAVSYTLAFGVLTAFRFLANPHFYMDYLSWFWEFEAGISIFAALLLTSLNAKRMALAAVAILLPFLTSYLMYARLGMPRLILKSPPVITGSLKLTSDFPKESLLFVTGSNVFWLNALYDVKQVRGGRDEVALNPNWRDASYIFRESTDQTKIEQSLELLNVNYVIVNTTNSFDFYKDYKNAGLWQGVGKIIASENGDLLIKVR